MMLVMPGPTGSIFVVAWERSGLGDSQFTLRLQDSILRQLERDGIEARSLRLGVDEGVSASVLDTLLRHEQPILISCGQPTQIEWLRPWEKAVQEGRAHALIIDLTEPLLAVPTMWADAVAPAVQAMRHATSAGYRRMLVLARDRAATTTVRVQAALAAAEQAGLACIGEPTFPRWIGIDPATVPLRKLLLSGFERLGGADDSEHTVVLAIDPGIAHETWHDVEAIRPGAGMIIINTMAAGSLITGITTVAPACDETARRVLNLIHLARAGEAWPRSHTLAWEVLVGGTTTATSIHEAGTAALRRSRQTISSASGSGDRLPSVVILDWDDHSRDQKENFHYGWMVTVRKALIGGLQQAGISHVTFGVIGNDWETTGLLMDRAAAAILDGQPKVVVVMDLALTAEAEAILTRCRQLFGLTVVRGLAVNVAQQRDPAVIHDKVSAGTLAAMHCLRQGYRRMAFVAPFLGEWVQERWESLRRSTTLAGGCQAIPLIIDPMTQNGFFARDLGFQQEQISRLIEPLLTMHDQRPLTLLGANDAVAAMVAENLLARGLRLGIDVGVMGFDDAPQAAEYQLTTLAPPMHTVGSELARVCVAVIRGDKVPGRVRLPWNLVVRSSTQLRG